MKNKKKPSCIENKELLIFPSFSTESHEAIFTNIYNCALWGKNAEGEGFSGEGSLLPNALEYMDFLQKFIKSNNIKTVLDLGCGDWEFSRHIDWTGIEYTGYDIVKSVVEKNVKKFSTSSIRFEHSNILSSKLPQADLVVCKDVLQHFSNEDILLLIQKISKYRYCLMTNSTTPGSFTARNEDIPVGNFRPIDLTKAPFFLIGEKILTYRSHDNDCIQVFFIDTQKNPI
jgi:SAM-dependent methyltransferase